MTMTESPIRFCSICRQADDAPRHDIWGTDPNVAPHMDCCASVGCPDGSCDVITRTQGEARGDEFRAMITAPEFQEETAALLDERDDATRNFRLGDLDQSVHGSVQGATEMELTR
jgi:hypothetical protein